MKYFNGICYSGYREGQSPLKKIYPSYEEIKEDLNILKGQYQYLRMYDLSENTVRVLNTIRKEKLPFKVMMGVEWRGEISNPNCPWGGLHSDEEIEANIKYNLELVEKCIEMAHEYEDVVEFIGAGNESTSEWQGNLVSPESVAKYAKMIKDNVNQKVTFCEGAYYWATKDQVIASVVDFISIHTYPLWNRVNASDALAYNIKDYEMVKKAYPDKDIIITEAGWATKSDSAGMLVEECNEESQDVYLKSFTEYFENIKVPTFLFEAFDEPWKGGASINEPEKHWGIYNVDRTPKKYKK